MVGVGGVEWRLVLRTVVPAVYSSVFDGDNDKADRR